MRSLIFINCGGLIDQTKLWFYQPEFKVQSFIFDSHRPFNHENIIDKNRKIYIMHDGCQSFEKYPTAEDMQILEEFADDDEEEDDYDQVDSDEEEIKDELEDLKDNDESEGEEIYGDKVDKQEEEDEIIGEDEDLDEQVKVGVKRVRATEVIDRRTLKRQKRALL